MEVILCENVHKLGKVGDVVKVKDGYARNFLIPQKKAYLATPGNLKRIEKQRAKEAAENERALKEAQDLAEKLSKVSCTVTVEVNDLDKLYGSVTEVDVVRALEVEGFTIDKKTVMIDSPIEDLGIFEVGVKLHPQVIAKIRVWVAKK
ncbi:MAG TPA: 50S ribosomal protein L9 [Candidatus Omnitrophota bacterium]|nr:50S ribosomal protein L9 [Candidatus Omnitrophota bacterium]HPB67577.1 50S ribosomal protein L9 [Candidatus Omnitrophota bacterium]HQO57228.1 50S ribosomal protein L9 [Candidatus Omnitrophota bacterium]